MRRCPYCGEKIQPGVPECEHCGKSLSKKNSDRDQKPTLTNLDSWRGRAIPTWVMVLAVAFMLFLVWIMIAKGCEGDSDSTPTAKAKPAIVQLASTS